MGLCFGFDVADLVAESDEVGVVRFQPLRIAAPSEEIVVREDGSKKIQVCFDSRDGCVLNSTTGFADSIIPCTSCDNDLRNNTVEVRTDAGRDTMNERSINADAVA